MGFRDGGDSGEGVRAGVKGEKRERGKEGKGEKSAETRDATVRKGEGDERGKNRDAPDWHEGLRLLACASATWRGSARH